MATQEEKLQSAAISKKLALADVELALGGDEDSDIDISETEELSYDEAKDWQMPFGKYKGTLLKQMIINGRRRHYLRYLLKWDDLQDNSRAKIQAGLDEYERVKEARPKETTQKTKQPKKRAKTK